MYSYQVSYNLKESDIEHWLKPPLPSQLLKVSSIILYIPTYLGT